MAEVFAFVLAEAFFSFTEVFVLVAAFAGGATGADALAAGLLGGTGAVFFGSAALAVMAGTGGTGGAVTAGEGFLSGAGAAALAGGAGTGLGG